MEIPWSRQKVKLATIGLLCFAIHYLIAHIPLQTLLISSRVF